MSLINSHGIVLKRVRHEEHDLKLTIFTRDLGRLIVHAKGAERPSSKWRAVKEPFSEADFQIFLRPHGVHARLITGKLLDSHQNLRGRLLSFSVAAKCCEAVDLLIPFRAPSPDVYDILRASLQALRSSPAPHVEWIIFVMRLLRNLGHGDISDRALGFLDEPARDGFAALIKADAGFASGVLPSETTLDRCRLFVENELAQILPWRLKSDVFEESLNLK